MWEKKMAIINDISPKAVDYQGGEEVVITGSGFTDASKVYFEDKNSTKTDANNFTVVSDKEIKVISPSISYFNEYTDMVIHYITVVVNDMKSTTPRVSSNVSDSSGGRTLTSKPTDANYIFITYPKPKTEFDDFADYADSIPQREG